MKIKRTGSYLASILLLPFVVLAQGTNVNVAAFREYAPIVVPPRTVPTVVEVPVTRSSVTSGEYLVVEARTGERVQSEFIEAFTKLPEPYTVAVDGRVRYTLTDRDRDGTGERFELPLEGNGMLEFDVAYARPVSISRVGFVFDRNVSLPTTIAVSAYDAQGNEQIVYRESRFNSEELAFIPTVAARWKVVVTYAQPLKVNELVMFEDEVETTVSRGVRFLAQPGSSYRIYQKTDRSVPPWYGPRADLRSTNEVLVLPALQWALNPSYAPADTDGDMIPDTQDNCVSRVNTDQRDIDGNGRGDVCDDYDRDGYVNSEDNCPNIPNYQNDTDSDGIGDECDQEESRLTERLPWVPWAGMSIAGIVVLGLFVFVALDTRKRSGVPEVKE